MKGLEEWWQLSVLGFGLRSSGFLVQAPAQKYLCWALQWTGTSSRGGTCLHQYWHPHRDPKKDKGQDERLIYKTSKNLWGWRRSLKEGHRWGVPLPRTDGCAADTTPTEDINMTSAIFVITLQLFLPVLGKTKLFIFVNWCLSSSFRLF